MITTRVRLFHFEKNQLINLELAKIQTRQIFDRYFWGDKLIGKYFDSKFQLCIS